MDSHTWLPEAEHRHHRHQKQQILLLIFLKHGLQ